MEEVIEINDEIIEINYELIEEEQISIILNEIKKSIQTIISNINIECSPGKQNKETIYLINKLKTTYTIAKNYIEKKQIKNLLALCDLNIYREDYSKFLSVNEIQKIYVKMFKEVDVKKKIFEIALLIGNIIQNIHELMKFNSIKKLFN